MGSTSDIIIDENLKKITYLPQVILSSNVLNNMCTENVFNDICVCLKSAHNPKYIVNAFCIYRTRVITACSLYIFHSIFDGHFFVFKEVLSLCKHG